MVDSQDKSQQPVAGSNVDSVETQSVNSAAAAGPPSTVTYLSHHAAAGIASGETLPQTFGRYRIVKELGGGGMGKVYLAQDTQLDREVALKIPKFKTNETAQVIERFYREARAMAALRHQNLCTVYDVGEIDEIHYLTMAYIEGQSLSDVLQSGRRRSNQTVAALIRKLALALHQAHQAGVVHRDLKPANIIIDKNAQPVVVDFGLARREHADELHPTSQGVVLGTPAYMSPEQAEGDIEAIGPPSDIYSLGVILYQLLAHRLPFQGSVAAVVAQILRDDPVPPSQFADQVDADLEAICLKAMAKRVDQRFLSMEELAYRLTGYLKATAPAAIPARQSLREQPEFIVLCPVCAARVDTTRQPADQSTRCPKCHTVISFHGRPRASSAKSETAAAGGEDHYRLSEPIELRPAPVTSQAMFPVSPAPETHADSASHRLRSTVASAPSAEADVFSAEPLRWSLLSRFLGESLLGFVADGDLLLRWVALGVMTLFVLFPTGYVIRDIGVTGFTFVSAILVILLPLVAVVLAILANFCLVVFQDIANGKSKIEGRPEGDVLSCLPESLYVAVPAGLALLPGFVIGQVALVAGAPSWLLVLCLTVSILTLFPIFFLSVVEAGSPLQPLVGQVWRSLRSEVAIWKLFYGCSLIIAVFVQGTYLGLSRSVPMFFPLAAIGLLTLPLIYFQLLGILKFRCNFDVDTSAEGPADE